MLRPAQLYESELQTKITGIWYDESYLFWNSVGSNSIDLSKDNWSTHQFVSVDKDNHVIGYICYSVDWCVMSADHFGAVSFNRGNITFAKDLYQVIVDLFEKYHMNRIQWFAFADNPAIRSYRNFIKKHGGVECAYYRQSDKLMDGKLHDSVCFEILAKEFKK